MVDGHDHDHDHEHEKMAEVDGELPVAEQDEWGDFDIEGEEVQIQIQGAVQSDNRWGCSESVGHVRPVVPEPDAIRRYLEGLDP